MLPQRVEVAAHGNAPVIALFEKWLAAARKGQLNYAAVIACGYPNLLAHDFAGSIEMEFAALLALEHLRKKLEQVKAGRAPPEKNPELSADYVCYNLAADPISYDFLPWLVDAEMTRVREGAPAPLRICFSFGRDADTGFNTEYRREMLANVMYPLLGLIGAVEDPKAIGGRNKQMFALLDVVRAVRAGEQAPRFRASEGATRTIANYLSGAKEGPVTITLREAEHWPHRNSNVEEWVRFAHWLEARGEQVVFVRDTAKAVLPLLGCATCPRASIDLDLRMALYEAAKCNYFVSNGPWNLAMFGSRPWVSFNQFTADDNYYPNTPEWWRIHQGIEAGAQYPWSTPEQRIVWTADTFEEMKGSWRG